MKKCIVTGASGFVGKHLVRELLSHDVEVYALAGTADSDIPDEGEACVHWIKGRFPEDTESIRDEILRLGGEAADCMYHLAWCGVAGDQKDDYKLQLSNMDIGMSALSVCEECSCRRFVYLDTVGEYVSVDGLINERQTPSPGDIYGAMKLSVGTVLAVQAGKKQIDMIRAILSSTYGEYRGDQNVITYTIKMLLAGKRPKFGRLEQMWDFLYVKDAAKALYLVGEKGIAGKTYSVGSGKYRKLYQYIMQIRDQIDPSLELGIGELGNRYEKIHNSCVDTFQIQKDTGFYPEYSFREGIDRTIRFYRTEGDKWED